MENRFIPTNWTEADKNWQMRDWIGLWAKKSMEKREIKRNYERKSNFWEKIENFKERNLRENLERENRY